MSSEKKYTPGPWVLNDEDDTIIITGGPDENYVCDVQVHQVPRAMGLSDEPTRIANAKVIGAVPILIETLEKIAAAALGGKNVQEKIYILAVEALKKATI